MKRGEEWVAGQVVLFALLAAAPPLEGPWPAAARRVGRLAGPPLILAGVGVALAGARGLGKSLTPFPRPREDAALVEHGVYGSIRHPIYSGVILIMLGTALSTQRLTRLGVAAGATVFFDAKARREERWLVERYPGYAAYSERSRRFIPGVY